MGTLALRKNQFMPTFWDDFFQNSVFNDDWFTNRDVEVYKQKPAHYFYDEENKQHVITAEVAGFTKDDIDIEIDERGIIISGEIKDEKLKERLGEKKISYIMKQENINPKDVEASLENGILEIRFKQKEKDKISQKIAIK